MSNVSPDNAAGSDAVALATVGRRAEVDVGQELGLDDAVLADELVHASQERVAREGFERSFHDMTSWNDGVRSL